MALSGFENVNAISLYPDCGFVTTAFYQQMPIMSLPSAHIGDTACKKMDNTLTQLKYLLPYLLADRGHQQIVAPNVGVPAVVEGNQLAAAVPDGSDENMDTSSDEGPDSDVNSVVGELRRPVRPRRPRGDGQRRVERVLQRHGPLDNLCLRDMRAHLKLILDHLVHLPVTRGVEQDMRRRLEEMMHSAGISTLSLKFRLCV